MAISEQQLVTWSNRGADSAAAATYGSIRSALEGPNSSIAHRNIDIYLQGSYRNATNVRGDSDVDVVVQLNETFQWDPGQLGDEGRRRIDIAYRSATYTFADFRSDVLVTLQRTYRAGNVTSNNKCITVGGSGSRLTADVVPCLEYRRFTRFVSPEDRSYVPGIVFYAERDFRRIINFPKVHLHNGEDKNQAARTGGRFKPVVRMFKNARTAAVDRGLLDYGKTPSYFLECFVYNASDASFGSTLTSSYVSVLRDVTSQNWALLQCENEQLPLIGDTPEQWSQPDAIATVDALLNLWEHS